MATSSPIYALSDVIAAATDADNVVFDGRRAALDAANLRYTLEDVARCIASLDASDFHKTLKYDEGNSATEFDVYKTKFRLNEEFVDDLYVKLAMDECGRVVVGSFKLE